MNGKDRNKSLCQKSMKMVVNIIKLSSFSIANMSLGVAGASAATKNLGPVTDSVMLANEPLLPQFSGSRRSEKPQNSAKPVSYLMEPNRGDESSYVIHDEKSVIDGMASAYIQKVHQKNRIDFSETSNLPPYILPPPPRTVK
ncbi:Homeobox-leucine zipper protein [Melia azedarach]|uniref:Homeobox-leucine zipper protein n=1 Tax=Melia azedarach TaxID=155640 RepID=A0ACC1XLN2_MELAZ|nr:Homeobox-leucine zipper protein [Melia azedarach]